MKSAYELAMERLAKSVPAVKLTDAQKREMAELESLYKSKIAQREIALSGEIEKSEEGGDMDGAMELRQRLANERKALEVELEAKKEKVRQGGAK